MNKGDVEEISMSGGAGAYNTPYAFVRKKTKGKKKKSKYKMNKPSGLVNYMDYSTNEGKIGDDNLVDLLQYYELVKEIQIANGQI